MTGLTQSGLTHSSPGTDAVSPLATDHPTPATDSADGAASAADLGLVTPPLGLPRDLLGHLIDEHDRRTAPRLRRLWDYYRNPAIVDLTGEHPRTTRLAQEQGLPARLARNVAAATAVGSAAAGPADGRRAEVVIENDIAWRLHAMVDFMVGRGVVLQSTAADPARATLLEGFLRRVLDRSGGHAFLQDLALLGAIYGHVDVLLRTPGCVHCNNTGAGDAACAPDPAADGFAFELIDPMRGIPVLDDDDYRQLAGYVVHHRQTLAAVERQPLVRRAWRAVFGRDGATPTRRASVERTSVFTADAVVHVRGPVDDPGSVTREVNRLGRVPVVHIQNQPQPYHYEGLSEVEPLIPLQDELNTRLCDRASRVTFQSFKMYLGKGIEGFLERPVGPGQMWATDNPDASIEPFGGDGQSPSEDAHIAEVRDALDKASGVAPVAAGIIRDKVGNLTSENALRVVLMGLLAKTQRKRVLYGAGLARLAELTLHAADVLGVLPNTPDERGIRLDWPSPVPEDDEQRLKLAALKKSLGVPTKRLLAELGYEGEEIGE